MPPFIFYSPMMIEPRVVGNHKQGETMFTKTFRPQTAYDVLKVMIEGESVLSVDGIQMLLNGISREDGSGSNWNITINVQQMEFNVFWREGTPFMPAARIAMDLLAKKK